MTVVMPKTNTAIVLSISYFYRTISYGRHVQKNRKTQK